MPYHTSRRAFRLGWTAAVVLTSFTAVAQPQADTVTPTRLGQVTLYASSATVERLASVPAGAQSLRVVCLPPSLDVASVQVQADAPVQVGEVAWQLVARDAQPECGLGALEGRIREVEDQIAAARAEQAGLTLAQGYLKGLTPSSPAQAGAVVLSVDAKQLPATVDVVKRQGQDAHWRQHQLSRQVDDLERRLKALQTERDRLPRTAQVQTLKVTVHAPREGQLRLRYQVPGAGWTPAYRGSLDASRSQLRIERQAVVRQTTGEDWAGASLVLVTGQPEARVSLPNAHPWTLRVAPPEPPPEARALLKSGVPMAAMAAPAPAPAAAAAPMAEAVSFDVRVFEGSLATEFKVPQKVDVNSSGQPVTFSLGGTDLPVQLLRRTVPARNTRVDLVAELPPPGGVWPAGPMSLYRDGAYVGQTSWHPSQAAHDGLVDLPFGRDERVTVTQEPERATSATSGFTGSRQDRKISRAYVIDSRHTSPITLEVLEASPTAADDQVRIERQFSPQPSHMEWRKKPGVVAWRQTLAPQTPWRLQADYLISVPKEMRVVEDR